MSKYFRTLKRLQSDSSEPLTDGTTELEAGQAQPIEQVYAFPGIDTVRSAKVRPTFSRLLDGLRLVAQSSETRCVVIADVSSEHASRRLIEGLEEQACQKPVSLVSGDFGQSERRALTLHRVSDSESPAAISTPLSLDRDAESLSRDVQSRLEQVAPDAEVAILRGPPLAVSVDSALLARATAGLVVVLEPQVTTRADLHLALSRASHSGSSVIGFVMYGSRHWLPKWTRRLL